MLALTLCCVMLSNLKISMCSVANQKHTRFVSALWCVLDVLIVITCHEESGLTVLFPLPPVVCRGSPLPAGPLCILRLLPPLPGFVSGPLLRCRVLSFPLITVQGEAVTLARLED